MDGQQDLIREGTTALAARCSPGKQFWYSNGQGSPQTWRETPILSILWLEPSRRQSMIFIQRGGFTSSRFPRAYFEGRRQPDQERLTPARYRKHPNEKSPITDLFAVE